MIAASVERSAAPGDVVVEQWDGSRELYVVLDGTARVLVDGVPARAIGAGDVFGEIAALEWGAGFGYARTASVVAETALRLVVLPAADVGRLIREAPFVGERLRSLARERLYSR